MQIPGAHEIHLVQPQRYLDEVLAITTDYLNLQNNVAKNGRDAGSSTGRTGAN